MEFSWCSRDGWLLGKHKSALERSEYCVRHIQPLMNNSWVLNSPKGGHCINYSPKHDHPESKLYCGIGTAISPCWSEGLEAQGYVVLSVVDSYFVGARSYENCSVHPFLVKLEHLSARSVLKTHTPCYVSHGTHTMTRVSYFPNFKRLLLLSSKIHAFLEYNLLLSEQHMWYQRHGVESWP